MYNIYNKKKNLTESSWYALSLFRNQLFGISILLLFVFHLSEDIWTNPKTGTSLTVTVALLYARLIGSVGVDIFIILSAIGLYFSLTKNNNLKHFYKRRFRRILPEYFIISIPLFFIHDIIILKQSFTAFLRDVFAISFFKDGNRSLWYIYFILFIYIVFPVIYEIRNTSHGRFYIIIAIVCSTILLFIQKYIFPTNYEHIEIATARIPVFLSGIYFAPNVYKRQKLCSGDLIFLTTVCALKTIKFCADMTNSYIPIISATRLVDTFFAFPVIFFILLIIRKKENSVLTFFGKYSYELYLIHVSVRQIIWTVAKPDNYILPFCIYVSLAVILSPLLHKIIK